MSRLNISVVPQYSFSTDSAGNLSNFLFPKVFVWSFSVIHFQNYFSHQPLLHGISLRTKTGGLAEGDLVLYFQYVYFPTLPVLSGTLRHNYKIVFYNSNMWRKKSQNTKNVSVFFSQILSNTFTFTLNLSFVPLRSSVVEFWVHRYYPLRYKTTTITACYRGANNSHITGFIAFNDSAWMFNCESAYSTMKVAVVYQSSKSPRFSSQNTCPKHGFEFF